MVPFHGTFSSHTMALYFIRITTTFQWYVPYLFLLSPIMLPFRSYIYWDLQGIYLGLTWDSFGTHSGFITHMNKWNYGTIVTQNNIVM